MLVQYDIFDVEKIARKLNGATGVDSVDAVSVKTYLTGYRRALAELREVLVDWAKWFANSCPDWAVYRGMTTRRLLVLDKEPGTGPVGIGSIWLRYIGGGASSTDKGCGAPGCTWRARGTIGGGNSEVI